MGPGFTTHSAKTRHSIDRSSPLVASLHDPFLAAFITNIAEFESAYRMRFSVHTGGKRRRTNGGSRCQRLTDTQRIILSAASQRDDCGVQLPANVKGEAARKVVDKLIRAGLLEEVRAAGSLPVWRRDDDSGPMALRITKNGLAAIDVEGEAVAASNETSVGPAPARGEGETPAAAKAVASRRIHHIVVAKPGEQFYTDVIGQRAPTHQYERWRGAGPVMLTVGLAASWRATAVRAGMCAEHKESELT
jgi:hypothetical protein